MIFLVIFLVRKELCFGRRTGLVGYVGTWQLLVCRFGKYTIPVAMHACYAEYDPKSLYSHVTSLSREYYRFVRKISYSCTMATKVY